MKTIITRLELKEIFDIACSTWKPKIEGFAKRTPFLNTIEFSKEEIEEMLSASTKDQFPIVKKIFNIIDKSETIKSLEDACKALGEKDEEVIDLKILKSKKASRKLIAFQELIVITKALNDGWKDDWDNDLQAKFILWWYLGKNFCLDVCGGYYSHSGVPARLCHKSREVALYSAKQFINIWKDAFNS